MAIAGAVYIGRHCCGLHVLQNHAESCMSGETFLKQKWKDQHQEGTGALLQQPLAGGYTHD